jgi:hypothetical protein
MNPLFLHAPRNAILGSVSVASRVYNVNLAASSIRHISGWTATDHAHLGEYHPKRNTRATADSQSLATFRLETPAGVFRRLSSTSTSGGSTPSGKDGPTDSTIQLPSHEEGRRSHISKRFSHVMDNVQTNIFIAGQRLNDLTGYSGIEALKKEIDNLGMIIPSKLNAK